MAMLAIASNLGRAFGRLYDRRQTVRFLVASNLKAGHRDKALGHLWSLLDPLLFVAVYFVVFGLLFGQSARGRGSDFLTYLVVGVLAWRFVDASVSQAANCIRSNRGLIHEISFPKAIFPVSLCLSRLYDFLWGLVVMLALLLIVRTKLSLHVVWVPLLILLQLLFTVGLAFIVAYLGAFFADTLNVVSVGMRLWFYCSPLFYYVRGEKSLIPLDHPDYRLYYNLYMLNPVACFIEAYRDSLLYARMPEPAHLLYMAVISLAVLLAGFALFVRDEGEFSKYV